MNMKKKYTVILISCLTIPALNVFSEDIRRSEETTVITREMASPSENKEAMEAYNKGSYLLKEKQFEEAEKYLLRAIELDNKFVDAFDHLGLVYRNMNRYEDAEKMYLLSIEINPNNSVPYINLAIVYRRQGRYEDARQLYLRAQKIDQDDPEPYFGIGVLYQMAERFELSIGFINIAIQKYYEKGSMLIGDAYFVQGNNYYYMEKYDEALKYYKAALIFNPEDNKIKNIINELENRMNEI
jgi:tetratricopeptide (TPR) repeat protein